MIQKLYYQHLLAINYIMKTLLNNDNMCKQMT